jgi:hypothetical protein
MRPRPGSCIWCSSQMTSFPYENATILSMHTNIIARSRACTIVLYALQSHHYECRSMPNGHHKQACLFVIVFILHIKSHRQALPSPSDPAQQPDEKQQ